MSAPRLYEDWTGNVVNGADVTTGIGMTFDNVERTVNIHSNVKSSFSPRNEKE